MYVTRGDTGVDTLDLLVKAQCIDSPSRPMSLRVQICLAFLMLINQARSAEMISADVCIYGGTAGGVVAAVQAKRMGKSVVLAEFGNHLGGMTSGGLGATDIGNKAANGGIARKFYQQIARHYATQNVWHF